MSDEFEAALVMNPETRDWELHAHGTAAAMLAFLLDSSKGSITTKFYTEALFDRIVAFADET